MPALAANAARMPRSGIREIMDLAWAADGPVLGLHVGEPSFATPDHVLAGAHGALDRRETRYAPNPGIPALREALARKVRERNGLAAEPGQVVVTAGGMQAIFAALACTVGAGDEVLLPDPGWPNFAMAVELVQGVPVRYPLTPERRFVPDPDALAALVTERTRVVIVNSPSNPLGAVHDEAAARALVRFAAEHDLWLLSDECYDAFTFGGVAHVSPAALDEDGRVLSCFSFSKTYAMTGLRVGYLVAPPAVAATAAKLQEPLVACVNVPAQQAALAALEGPQEPVEEMRRTYEARRDAATALLRERGRRHLPPDGAFYLWVDVRDRCRGDVAAWARELVTSAGVAVAPGTAFGPSGEGWVRTSLAAPTDDLLEGLRRLDAR